MKDEEGEFETFDDILPDESAPTSGGSLLMLLIGHRPHPKSVTEHGHYFCGRDGERLWRQLSDHRILMIPDGVKYKDIYLPENGYGATDIIKRPAMTGKKAKQKKYIEGSDRILGIVQKHQPLTIVFVYKRPLRKILEIKGKANLVESIRPGHNRQLAELFHGSQVYYCPISGRVKTEERRTAMEELRVALKK